MQHFIESKKNLVQRRMLHELVPASLHTANMVTEIIHELDLAFQDLAGAWIVGVDPGAHLVLHGSLVFNISQY